MHLLLCGVNAYAEDNFPESVLFFHLHVDSRDLTQVVRIVQQALPTEPSCHLKAILKNRVYLQVHVCIHECAGQRTTPLSFSEMCCPLSLRHTSVNPALRKLSKKDLKFKVNLDYRMLQVSQSCIMTPSFKPL